MFKIYLVEVKKKYKTAGIIYIYIYIYINNNFNFLLS